MKDEVFQLRVSEDDRRRMELLSRRFGVSMAGVIRMLLRQAVSEEELETAPLGKEVTSPLVMALN
jgi:antitoxin component of RelBE/YafQ-DinJ toxin-antitoxin module